MCIGSEAITRAASYKQLPTMHALDEICFIYDHHVQLQNHNQGHANTPRPSFVALAIFVKVGWE